MDHIDSGHIALPEFQRGYVWNRKQVSGLFDSLYKRHPVGSLLVWVTESKNADHRGEGTLAPGVVKLLLDGQQRITSLYGVIRGKAPEFFDGDPKAFTDLMFHLGEEKFSFYQPIKMKDDPLWINVTDLLKGGPNSLGVYIAKLSADESVEQDDIADYIGKLSRLLGIVEIDLHIEEVTGQDKTIDVVVDIFNKVNSGGTKLSKGDLALAKICADWPEARDAMKEQIEKWEQASYHFNLDWLLRSINTVVTGEAKFQYLHDKSPDEIREGLNKAVKYIDNSLNMIAGRLGLDHDQVLFGRFAIPVMVRYLDKKNGHLNEVERDRLLFWYLQSGMWGRFSGSTESYIDKDLEALEGNDDGLDRLIEQLKLWHGSLQVEPGHFKGWSLGARFYPVLYMITRMGGAKDWGTGLPLKANLLGKMNKLEVHHIFPKAQLYKRGYDRVEVNALANFCFLTKDTNLKIRDRLPEEYFYEVESKHPGALASQWIPMDESLWRVENYPDFLAQRQILLAEEVNRQLEELLHGEKLLQESVKMAEEAPVIIGGITSEEEEQALISLNEWVRQQGLSEGIISYDFADPVTGEQKAVFDLAWPNGVQEDLSEPVAVLLNETMEVILLASRAGFRCFTGIEDFKKYIEQEILNNQ